MRTPNGSITMQTSISTQATNALGRFRAWYASWGTWGSPIIDMILAHIRMIRPVTRIWFDTLLPLTTISLLTDGNPPVVNTTLFILSMNLIHIGFTILNDLQDVVSDRSSSELLRSTRPIANNIIPRELAYAEFFCTIILGVAITCFISWALAGVATFLCLLLLAHELPPIRTQSRPVLSPIAGLVGFACIFLTMMITANHLYIDNKIFYILFVAIYLGIGGMIAKDIRDVDNDSKGGKQTPAVKYGAPTATRIATIAYALAGAAWVWFVLRNRELAGMPLLFATFVMALWVSYTIVAGRLLSRGFSKAICVSIHSGSIIVLALVNVCVLWAL